MNTPPVLTHIYSRLGFRLLATPMTKQPTACGYTSGESVGDAYVVKLTSARRVSTPSIAVGIISPSHLTSSDSVDSTDDDGGGGGMRVE